MIPVDGKREESVAPVPDAGVLVVERLCKSFGDRVAVSDVSFKLAAGEVFGFLGPNGAGKTTTVRTSRDVDRADVGIGGRGRDSA